MTTNATIMAGSKAKNITIRAGEHVIAPDLAEVSGYVIVYQGATFTAPALEKAGHVIVEQGATFTAPVLEKAGDVIVYQEATFTAPEYDPDLVFREIENDGEYALCKNAHGLYRAGCRGPFTAEQALEHGDGRPDRRATLFAAAIQKSMV